MKKMLEFFRKIGNRHNIINVFTDFLEIEAIVISNSMMHDAEKEERYKYLINKYNKMDQYMLGNIAGELAITLEEEPNDWLGKIFMELLGGKHQGQFFTPYHITKMITAISLDHERIKRDGFIKVKEPSAGGGAMIIALAEEMKRCGYNIEKQLIVECSDLDINSVYMCYIQLSLLGIRAKVSHKNSLTDEVFGSWRTPIYKIYEVGAEAI